jgi:NAD+ kinase
VKHAAVLANTKHAQVREILHRALETLRQHQVQVSVPPELARLCPKGSCKAMSLDKAIKRSDWVLAFGGDGTLLRAAQVAAPLHKPILGIHLGRKGYLSAAPAESLEEAIAEALKGHLKATAMTMLQAKVCRKGRAQGLYNALNDVVIARSGQGRLVELDAWVDAKPLTRYLADGLILATPTGSTAYALSAGGPLLQPGLPCLVLAPIAPHTLSHRPLVISDASVVRLAVPEDGRCMALAVDGQAALALKPGDEIWVQKAPFSAMLLLPKQQDWRETLRLKLGWRGY